MSEKFDMPDRWYSTTADKADKEHSKEGTKTITFAIIEEAFGLDLSSLTAPNKNTIRMEFFFSMNVGT